MSNNDNLYPIDKSNLSTVRFDPPDSSYLTSDNILRMAKCLAMLQEVRKTVQRLFPAGFYFDRSDLSDPTKLFTVGQFFTDSNTF